MDSKKSNNYVYDRGQHRWKHCWKHDHADFIETKGHLVGKCPKSLTNELAEQLLQFAIPEPDPFSLPNWTNSPCPSRYYAVHDGVIYEAAVTEPGKSYHGYPWTARKRGRLPDEVLWELRVQAAAKGCLEAMEDWLDQHGRC